jgi:hypothetical protein
MLSVTIIITIFGAVAQPQTTKTGKILAFNIKPIQSSFDTGSDIILEFSLKNESRFRVLATREAVLHDSIYLEIIDEHGKEISWQGRIVSRSYPSSLFIVLEPGDSTTFRAAISRSDGTGYDLRKPGIYRVGAEFSLSPKEYFAEMSNGAVVPDHPVRSNWSKVVLKRR